MSKLNRRDLFRIAAASVAGCSASGWGPLLADQLAASENRRRHCILLWMTGGPSQIDTFDMKPDHANGGEFSEIATNVPGVRFSEHLPKLATRADRLAVVRSLSTSEGDHSRATYLMRTGQRPGGVVRYPAIGSSLSKELGAAVADVPNYVSIAPPQAINAAAFGPGFLGPRYAPLTVSAAGGEAADGEQQPFANLRVSDLRLRPGVAPTQAEDRLALWQSLQDGFLARHQVDAPLTHDTVYRRAIRMMRSDAARAFDLDEESDGVRAAYGRGVFGQGCLMARRLVERGVPFVEVALGDFTAAGWDTHQNNFPVVRALSAELDAGWATLMGELDERGLLDATTIIWMGEFGRTPAINQAAGRDHHPAAWSAVLAGGGIAGGQAFGRTSADGMSVEDGKVEVVNLLATLCEALGVDPATQNVMDIGRPIRIVDGEPIESLLA